MCGVAGFACKPGVGFSKFVHSVAEITESLRLRGPDAEGIWSGDGVVLGHRRLSILDLDPRSNQPFISRDGNFVIVFNGEIYNFRELRAELEEQGEVFRTTSDTEVLLTMFAREREQMLPRLRGMFAFAIWEVRTRELFLARDPYGIKPLYYVQTPDGVGFASQVKALISSGLVHREEEWAGITGFYLWGSVPEPWTQFRGVFAVPAGSWVKVRCGQIQSPVSWNDIRSNWQLEGDKRTKADLLERVRTAVTNSVRAHLVSDVPVSLFLSGGIDSAAIAGLLCALGAQVEAITIGFSEFASSAEDEVPDAALLAKYYGLPHHVRMITSQEFESELPRILSAMDLPSIDGINTYFACKAAAERGYKVALSGVGGDELFHGYRHMRTLPTISRSARIISRTPGATSMLRGACEFLGRRRHQPKFSAIPDFIGSIDGAYFLRRSLFLPSELSDLIGQEEARYGLERLGGFPPGIAPEKAVNDEARLCQLESTLYLRNQLLRDSDWASMAHSLELRTPLVDATLLATLKDSLTGFAGGVGKRLLAQAPSKSLPNKSVLRPKTGFSVPMTHWMNSTRKSSERAESISSKRALAPWARMWARTIAEASLQFEGPTRIREAK